ncbi:MAG: hypothetical protein OXU33_09750 [Gemmatimonadota bacterium]|nr:hypothetical protein [Gemmatimonadota bacterium]
MIKKIKAPVLAVAAVFTLTGCDLLDVDNPNSLVEEDIQREAAANGVANGSLRLASTAIADVWEGPAVVSDELYWTGSRDAWGQLDAGFIDDPYNEFTDGAFPGFGQAVWMAREAVEVLSGHVANNPGDADFARDLARAQMFRGMVLMVVGESQEDMTFSDKQEDGAPVGPGAMGGILDQAIAELDAAAAAFSSIGEADLALTATAIRARAKMSRAIWDVLNPSATVGTALAMAAARTDAETVLASVGGSDWKYNLTFSSASASNPMGSNVNNRGENQWDESLVENTGPGASGRTGVVNLIDPVTGAPDLAVGTALTQWGTNQYGPVTIASERLMRLIVAEDALAGGDTGEFETQINAIRDLDGYASNFVQGGAVSDVEALTHHRRVNTLFMGLRMQDMYRWGITLAKWDPQSAALTAPGTMLPITIVECRANTTIGEANC